MVVEAAELLDSCSLPLLGLGVVKDWQIGRAHV